MSAYGEAALARACADMAATRAGRNTALNRSAFSMGTLVGAGEIERRDVERALFAAASTCGYVAKDGASTAKATIKSGLDRGVLKPRQVRRDARRAPRKSRAYEPPPHTDVDEATRECAKVQWVWRQRRSIVGSIADVYLREARGCGGVIPPTLGFLPAREHYPPALIAAFGLCSESEPGELAIDDDAVLAVQIVRLKADGSGKADIEPQKLVIGRGALGVPIVLAPPNDLSGLAICEGLEDALSVHAATGLGAWASAGAGRLPALADAVPSYVDFVTIVADRDLSGIKGANRLADGLRKRGIECAVTFPDAGGRGG